MLYSEPDFNSLRCEVSSHDQDNTFHSDNLLLRCEVSSHTQDNTFHSDNLLYGVRVCNRVWNARMTDPES